MNGGHSVVVSLVQHESPADDDDEDEHPDTVSPVQPSSAQQPVDDEEEDAER